MDQAKKAVCLLADKSDLVDQKRCGQGGQRLFQAILRYTQLVVTQGPGQGDVKAELVDDIGIAPALQMRVLRRRQPGGAAAGNLCFRSGRTKHVEVLHAICRQCSQMRLMADRNQCKETAQSIQLQSFQPDRGLGLGELCKGSVKVIDARAVRQSKGRLQGGMQTVFTWGLRQRGDAGHVRLRDGAARNHIPAQPRCSGSGKGLHPGHIINGISHEL